MLHNVVVLSFTAGMARASALAKGGGLIGKQPPAERGEFTLSPVAPPIFRGLDKLPGLNFCPKGTSVQVLPSSTLERPVAGGTSGGCVYVCMYVCVYA